MQGLIPAIAQDAKTGEVLMLAYMNAESLRRTLKTGYAHYYSRSRSKLWKKGETSGHVQRVREIRFDCDRDTILLKVDQTGPACHTGRPTCFFRVISRAPSSSRRGALSLRFRSPPPSTQGSLKAPLQVGEQVGEVLSRLCDTIDDRLRRRPRGSYTVALTTPNRKKRKSGLDKVLEKIGEESTEVVLAAKGQPKKYVVSEVSDLLYHLMVMLRLRGISPDDIGRELARRGA